MEFDSIVNRIDSLPPLPESLLEMERLYARGEPDMRVLSRIIEKDPVLTANILARVNAPYYGMKKKIVSVMQAVMLFGAIPIRGFAMGSLVDRNFSFDMHPYGLSNSAFLEVSSLQSALMFQWYMGVDIEMARDLIPIAFLMEIGKIIIAKEVIESDYVTEFSQMIAKEGAAQTEHFFTEVTSGEVAAMLFEHWNFNEIFINTMDYLDYMDDAPKEYLPYIQALDVVQTCVNVSEIMTQSSFEAAKNKIEQYGLPLNHFVHTVKRLQRKRSVHS
ncbi:HDOD domain-containing protein [bacterium]|nr:HDOD domain-containing protein [bacterium]MBU1884789.1 HDOD domain-containing protein [bacterium]